jgi:hypothetical protein
MQIIGPVYKISTEVVHMERTPKNKYAHRFIGHMKVLLGSCHERMWLATLDESPKCRILKRAQAEALMFGHRWTDVSCTCSVGLIYDVKKVTFYVKTTSGRPYACDVVLATNRYFGFS